mmetsp:Transcript_25893/g.4384  ORF Transcript_25893/g.4384 Transcript_25893/m.4384 type:complete len:115 (+) Transcript_25893:559-903(+)
MMNVDVDIWPHDIVVIYASDKWTLPTSLSSCASVGAAGVTNYFKTNISSSEYELQCTTASTEHAIYIYGIANEIDISEQGDDDNELPLHLDIGGFMAPSADWNSNNYFWQVEIL